MRYLVVLIALVTTACQAAKPSVPLASGGQAQVAIYTSPADHPELQATAATLADYLKSMSGATFAMNPTDGPAGRIELVFDTDHPRLAKMDTGSYAILTEGTDRILIVGRSPKAVADGAHGLLHDLGVRWLQPGERWTVVPTRPELAVAATDVVTEPSFPHRDIWYAYGLGIDESKLVLGADYQRWVAGNRLGGVSKFKTGHTYPNTVGNHLAEFEAHPEYFAMQPDGTRMKMDRYSSLCYSNPDVAAFFVADKVAELRRDREANPFAYSVSMDPNDGSIACNCEPCRALGNGSDQALYLANKVAVAVREEYPGAIVSFYVYASHRMPPEKVKAQPNVYVQVATAFNKSGLSLEELVARWRDTVSGVGIRDYLGVMAWDWGLPGRARGTKFSYVKTAIPQYKAWGAISYNSETNINWGAAGPATTTAARLLWDPSQDADALYAEWFDVAYGPAARTMRGLYDMWERDQEITRDNLHLWYRQLELAFRDATDADQGVKDRLTDMVILLHYCRLFRDWQIAEKTGDRDTAHAALLPMLEFTWRCRERGMVHAYALQRRLVNSGAPVLRPLKDGYHFKDPEAVWKHPMTITDAELRELFAADLLATPPDDRYRRFTGELTTYTPELAEEPLAGFLRYGSVWQVRVPEGAPLAIDLPMAGVRAHYRLTVTNAAGEVVSEADADIQGEARYAQQAFTLPVKLPAAGLYRFEFTAGEDYRPDFPAEWIVALDLGAKPSPMVRFLGPTTVYVPAGTTRVLLRTDGRVSIVAPGKMPLTDYSPADVDPELECVVIPVRGATPQVWLIVSSTSARFSFLNIPSVLGRQGQPMLVPADALEAKPDAQ